MFDLALVALSWPRSIVLNVNAGSYPIAIPLRAYQTESLAAHGRRVLSGSCHLSCFHSANYGVA